FGCSRVTHSPHAYDLKTYLRKMILDCAILYSLYLASIAGIYMNILGSQSLINLLMQQESVWAYQSFL
ncbi:hypothetical protein, partial [uncultured Duncaniella sp.]|uniref:hypothetical protein n=1 Tax=uncultured Duncaniella sp. TaxID=2768039 RepID=UPI0025A95DED